MAGIDALADIPAPMYVATMALDRTLQRHRYLLQVAAIAVVTTACVLMTDAFGFRSPVNLVWMIGLPVLIATVANVGWDRRCFMAMALIGLSLVTGVLVGVNFTSYG